MSEKIKYTFLEHVLFPVKRLNKTKLAKTVNGKTILITGATFGIGEQLSLLLGNTNSNLILVGRTIEKLENLKTQIEVLGGNVQIIPTNLTDNQDIEGLTTTILGLEKGVDIFVSNAGRSIRRSINDSLDRFHDFERTMNLNYYAPVKLMLKLIPILKQNKAQVINVSAINVLLIPAPKWSAYQASKAAFDNWFRCVLPELNVDGVVCTTIYLPLVKTRMISPTKAYDKMPAMKPEEVAKLIGKLMINRKSKFQPWWLIYGQLGSVIFRRLFERGATRSMRKK
jgi:short-subunit dehydrogenase